MQSEKHDQIGSTPWKRTEAPPPFSRYLIPTQTDIAKSNSSSALQDFPEVSNLHGIASFSKLLKKRVVITFVWPWVVRSSESVPLCFAVDSLLHTCMSVFIIGCRILEGCVHDLLLREHNTATEITPLIRLDALRCVIFHPHHQQTTTDHPLRHSAKILIKIIPLAVASDWVLVLSKVIF